jgi:hypothetical protein
VEEGATFSWTDPLPFLVAMRTLATDTMSGPWERVTGRARGRLLRLLRAST